LKDKDLNQESTFWVCVVFKEFSSFQKNTAFNIQSLETFQTHETFKQHILANK